MLWIAPISKSSQSHLLQLIGWLWVYQSGLGMNFHHQYCIQKNLKTFVFPMIESLVDLPGKFADCIWLLSPPNPEHNPLITLHKVLSSPAFMSVKHLNLSNIPNLSEFPDNIFLPKLVINTN
jgi:hypothetical protein